MGRDALSAGLLLLIMVVQVVVVNRLPLPGQAAPDLVLLGVVGYALARGATAGAVMGFGAGLMTDVLPPAAHMLGQCAAVLCLLGFAAGRMAESRPDSAPLSALACAVAGPVVAVTAGVLLGDARIDGSALTTTLPWAVGYNLLAAPPTVWLAARVARGPRERVLRPVGRLARGRT
ncbi:hypothetical protein GCM10017673_56880 [Streptosporangium violaceochromogenes]|nr:hypothetical protein GCM10017673_56880 [Streptosporangium violaceochromogenes]